MLLCYVAILTMFCCSILVVSIGVAGGIVPYYKIMNIHEKRKRYSSERTLYKLKGIGCILRNWCRSDM